jgi:hypothetical protein
VNHWADCSYQFSLRKSSPGCTSWKDTSFDSIQSQLTRSQAFSPLSTFPVQLLLVGWESELSITKTEVINEKENEALLSIMGANDGNSINDVPHLNGASHTNGVNGAAHTNGTNGTSHTNGINGSSHTNGVNGTSHTNGVNGHSHTNGVNGTSHTNGINGHSHPNGHETSPINGIDDSTANVEPHMPIAICGMALRLPGGSSSPEEFWDFLINKGDARMRVPLSRYNVAAYHTDVKRPGSVASEYGYFLDESVKLGALDTSRFSLSRAELEFADPQQRRLLEVVREAFDDAGDVTFRVSWFPDKSNRRMAADDL